MPLALLFLPLQPCCFSKVRRSRDGLIRYMLLALLVPRPSLRSSPLRMLDAAATDVITPIGPFCPFRSEACRLDGNVDSGMGSLTQKSSSFMGEMARIQLDVQMGNTPDPERVRGVAADLEAALSDWEVLMSRLRLSSDFQSREYFKMTEAHLKKAGQRAESALRPV